MVDMKPITVTHLYPASMNIYGDTGNVATIRNRLERRGFEVIIAKIDIGDVIPADTDILIAGGGQDEGQLRVADDLQSKKDQLIRMRDEGVPMLVICGTYQLFGHWFKTGDGKTIPGIGVFDMTTTAGQTRQIGNVVGESAFGRLVGFENHSGQTHLNEGQAHFAKVAKGIGNNEDSELEGAISGHVIGSYCHGPMLPKNVAIADELIRRALERRGITADLAPLDDSLAEAAANTAASRPR